MKGTSWQKNAKHPQKLFKAFLQTGQSEFWIEINLQTIQFLTPKGFTFYNLHLISSNLMCLQWRFKSMFNRLFLLKIHIRVLWEALKINTIPVLLSTWTKPRILNLVWCMDFGLFLWSSSLSSIYLVSIFLKQRIR